MKFRVVLKRNLDAIALFPTYFKTKREAIAYANQFDDGIIQKKLCESWVTIQ